MPISPKSMQFKLWIMLLLISLVLVFIAFKAFETKISVSLQQETADEEPFEQLYEFSSTDNSTAEEMLFSELNTRMNLFLALIAAISASALLGFVIKFFQERQKEK